MPEFWLPNPEKSTIEREGIYIKTDSHEMDGFVCMDKTTLEVLHQQCF